MELVKCPFCSKEIENDSFYCDQCGEELKLCPAGHGFKKGKICNDCGTKLVEAKTAVSNQASQPAPQPTAAQPQPQQPQPQPQPQQPQPRPQATETRPQATTKAAKVENIQPLQADAPEKTIRPTTAPAEPKYLVSNTLNARLELKNGAIIGRRAGDYVHVFGTQAYVSGTHARLQKNAANVWEIVDLDSSNGTFLNGQKLFANQPAMLKTGDTVAFYDLKFAVE